MSRKIVIPFLFLFLFFTSSAYATIVTWDETIGDWTESPGEWETLEGYSVVDSSYFIGYHGQNFYWSMDDEDFRDSTSSAYVIFNNIYNSDPGNNFLNVYVIDADPGDPEYDPATYVNDNASLGIPDWTGWTQISGTWTYYPENDGETYDVVFEITPEVMALLLDEDSFYIGVDPDCYFLSNRVFVEGVSPVPEPATMLLLGTGLVGLAGFGRKRFFKKG